MEALKGNAIVGQSGGPTSAINATLSGVIRGAKSSTVINTLYGMKNGIEGLLARELVDLSYLYNDNEALRLLEATPSAFLGSCRKRLPNAQQGNETYEKIFEIFKSYNIRYFFYIGGNDSMDAVLKLSEYAKAIDYKIKIIGVPKTIDNDLPLTDHAPGYGSSAKFISTTIKEIARDTSVYLCKAVTIVEIMGRDAGWLAASCGLVNYFGYDGVDLIYLPEVSFSDEKFINDLNVALSKKPNVLVAVSEGIRYSNGRYVGEGKQSGAFDVFGHKYLSGTAKVLECLVKDKIGCKVRSIELNLPQRCSAHLASDVDISESIKTGKFAISYAKNGQSGKMVSILRQRGKYKVSFAAVDVAKVASSVKNVPRHFINEKGNYVTKECMEYIAPLIQGERNIKYENGLPVHLKLRG